MKKSNLEKYWNKYYLKKIKFKESTFAKFTYNFLKKKKIQNIIDIGCGNGRDSIYFANKGFDVTGIDISKTVILLNSNKLEKNLRFIKFDIEKNKIKKKFDIIYSRFFLHAISEKAEVKLMKIINSIKKNSYIFFEFRNDKDEIFKKFNNINHNQVVEFEKGHYRRIINAKKFIENFTKFTKTKLIYLKSSKNLSVHKNDNPNLTRVIFKS